MLSSDVRIQLLKLLSKETLNVNEIAERLKIPISSAAMNVKMLEEASLIRTKLEPGIRGSKKICIKQVDELHLTLTNRQDESKVQIMSMPIGNYVDYRVEPTCGMVSINGPIDEEDAPRCFYNARRTEADLLWFGDGYVEYRFSNAGMIQKQLEQVVLSVELCAEAKEYNLDYPSDITLWMNGLNAGTFHCQSDYGGRRGKLNPDWWDDTKSQYGNLKTWRINSSGTYLDDELVMKNCLQDYKFEEHDYISVRIGIMESAKHIGGVNIFGKSFGDYPQDIVMELEFRKDGN